MTCPTHVPTQFVQVLRGESKALTAAAVGRDVGHGSNGWTGEAAKREKNGWTIHLQIGRFMIFIMDDT